MHKQLTRLGTRLKERRRKLQMTLQALADRTGLTAGLLSKIENFRSIPSLPVLISIAKALEIELSELFEGISFEEGPPYLHIRKSEQFKVEREESSGLEYRMILESSCRADTVQVMLVIVSPEAKREIVSGDGKELLYLLSGELEYTLGEDKITLNAGDTLLFDGALPHVPCNHTRNDAVILAVYFLKND